MNLSSGGTNSTRVNVKMFGASSDYWRKKDRLCLFPHSSGVVSSKHARMRELRIQHEGRPYRVLYAFDPRRTAILLIGGDKTGNDRWYEENVPIADQLYDQHLQEVKCEASEDQRKQDNKERDRRGKKQ